jgi:hypothetical protein
MLRSTLREFYPGALEAFGELGHLDALAVLEVAPTPVRSRGLSRAEIASALRREVSDGLCTRSSSEGVHT